MITIKLAIAAAALSLLSLLIIPLIPVKMTAEEMVEKMWGFAYVLGNALVIVCGIWVAAAILYYGGLLGALFFLFAGTIAPITTSTSP